MNTPDLYKILANAVLTDFVLESDGYEYAGLWPIAPDLLPPGAKVMVRAQVDGKVKVIVSRRVKDDLGREQTDRVLAYAERFSIADPDKDAFEQIIQSDLCGDGFIGRVILSAWARAEEAILLLEA